MKSPVAPFRPALERTMKEARETLAAEIYASAAIKETLSREAGKGLSSAVITTAYAVDLRETPAAETLTAWLKKQGLRADWSRRTDPQKTNAIQGDFWDLVVSWDGSTDTVVR